MKFQTTNNAHSCIVSHLTNKCWFSKLGPYYKPARDLKKPTLCYEVCTKGWAGLGILGPYVKKNGRTEVCIILKRLKGHEGQ